MFCAGGQIRLGHYKLVPVHAETAFVYNTLVALEGKYRLGRQKSRCHNRCQHKYKMPKQRFFQYFVYLRSHNPPQKYNKICTYAKKNVILQPNLRKTKVKNRKPYETETFFVGRKRTASPMVQYSGRYGEQTSAVAESRNQRAAERG